MNQIIHIITFYNIIIFRIVKIWTFFLYSFFNALCTLFPRYHDEQVKSNTNIIKYHNFSIQEIEIPTTRLNNQKTGWLKKFKNMKKPPNWTFTHLGHLLYFRFERKWFLQCPFQSLWINHSEDLNIILKQKRHWTQIITKDHLIHSLMVCDQFGIYISI